MILFRSAAFYLALLGIGLASALIIKLRTPEPAREIIFQPAVNPFKSTIAASGLLESVDKNIEIGAPQSGLVKNVFVIVGDFAEENDPLFQLDDRDLLAQLMVLKANAIIAEATLHRLKDQLARLESVHDKRAITEEELQTRRHDVIVAEAQLKAAEAEIKQVEFLADRLIVRAPKEGTILQSNIRKGEYLSTASNISPIVLGDIQRLQVRADIDEQNACDLDPTASATAYPKNNSSLGMPLKFVRVEPLVIPKKSLTGSSDERVDTRVLQVIYQIDPKPDHPLYVGQQLDVFIQKAEPQELTTNEEQANTPESPAAEQKQAEQVSA